MELKLGRGGGKLSGTGSGEIEFVTGLEDVSKSYALRLIAW